MPIVGGTRAIIVWALILADGAMAEVRVSDACVPLRDGVRLNTKIYSAAGLTEALPVVLLRTPYNQDHYAEQARFWAEHGYVAVTQDCRGRFGSEGNFGFYWGEGPDGFDTVEWIRRQSWCNGRLGMWGPSYMGSVQWLAAAEGAHLTALAPTASAANFYGNVHLDGVYLLTHAKTGFCSDLFGPACDLGSSPDWPQHYLHLPLTDWGRHLGRELPWQMAMIAHPRPDGFWRRANARPAIPQMNFAGQHIVGYFDFMCRESVGAFQDLVRGAAAGRDRPPQQLILGPWDHATGKRHVAECDFGPAAELDVLGENLQWFARYLKPSSATEPPLERVRYFSLGDDRWYTADAWPPAEAEEKAWYLHSAGGANTLRGNGRLDSAAPTSDEPADVLWSDPDDPVPSWPARGRNYQEVWGPVDQTPALERDDVLVYYGSPCERAWRFAGSPRVELWVATDAVDADWVVKLLDVSPAGVALPWATGVARGSVRESELEPSPLEPGRHYRLVAELGHIAGQVQPGHRLAVQIAGSHFPIFERNLHTGEGPEGTRRVVARQWVFHSAAEPSRLILPVVERPYTTGAARFPRRR